MEQSTTNRRNRRYYCQEEKVKIRQVSLSGLSYFFLGSGTALRLAKKLGRYLIGADLSKFAIQVTGRLSDTHNSNDLMEGER
ncbi:MAG: hypothetical protein ACP5US_09870 [Candidatus Kryptoniota bacterium]